MEPFTATYNQRLTGGVGGFSNKCDLYKYDGDDNKQIAETIRNIINKKYNNKYLPNLRNGVDNITRDEFVMFVNELQTAVNKTIHKIYISYRPMEYGHYWFNMIFTMSDKSPVNFTDLKLILNTPGHDYNKFAEDLTLPNVIYYYEPANDLYLAHNEALLYSLT